MAILQFTQLSRDLTHFFYIYTLLVLTFFDSRVVMGPYLLYYMVAHRKPDANIVLYYTNLFIVVFFMLMDFYWFV